MWQDVSAKDKESFNKLATHPLQAYEWGEFRKKTGLTVIRKGFFEKNKLTQILQLTLHPVPHTPWTIGYFPKGVLPTPEVIEELKRIGQKNKCIFIQLEPNVFASEKAKEDLKSLGLYDSAHPLFTKYTFQLNLTPSPEDLLKNMSQKTRYNIRVAIKHNVHTAQEYSPESFAAYLKLMEETTNRQGFFAHTKKYHELMWESLKTNRPVKLQTHTEKNTLEAHLFLATLNKQPLTAWIVFTFHDSIYYPYGASTSQHREAMASNLMMWDVLMYGKKMGLRVFDMWGALGPNPDSKDPWYGFHRFKLGYGPTLVEFVGSYDLVIQPILYQGYKVADKLRWLFLRLRK